MEIIEGLNQLASELMEFSPAQSVLPNPVDCTTQVVILFKLNKLLQSNPQEA
jgi:hypothetical protein